MKKPTPEDWQAVARVCEYFQDKIKGVGIVVPVQLEYYSSDPAPPTVDITITRAKCLIYEGPLTNRKGRLILSPRHFSKEVSE